jgi:hypothetical protein
MSVFKMAIKYLFVHVVIIKKDPSSSAFEELAETLLYGLKAIGIDATSVTNTIYPHAINIILGVHLLTSEEISLLPNDAIIYNTEQIFPDSPWNTSHLLTAIQQFTTWDYSLRNIERLAQQGITKEIVYMPVGFVPELCRIPKAVDQDIDVLFYGSMNERRQYILQTLIDRGLKVVVTTSTYGAARDALIARAKVVLNLHFYQSKIFEIVRVSYLLSNHKAIVAEVDDETDIEPKFRNAVVGVSYEQLVDACIELVNDEARRKDLEQRGFDIMASTSEAIYLKKYFDGK